MKNKFGVITGKVVLSLFAFVFAAVISAIFSELLGLRFTNPGLTLLFFGTLGFPIWYQSKTSLKLIAIMVGPIAGLLFWAISLVIPVEEGSGTIFVVGAVKGGAFIIGMLLQLLIMRKGRASSVNGTPPFEEKDEHPPKLMDNNEMESGESSIVDAKPVKFANPWRKKLLIVWSVLSILWIIGVSFKAWNDYGHLLTEEIERVRLDIEIMVPRKEQNNSNYDSLNPYDEVVAKLWGGEILKWDWFSVKKLKPDSSELAQARNNFPSMKNMTNSEFSDHLWSLVRKEKKKEQAQRSKRFNDGVLEHIPPMVIFPSAVLIFGSAISWGLRKYPPNQLTPYAKKVIVVSAVWVMGAISWFMIEEGGDIDYIFEYEFVLVYLLPPLVLIVAAIFWKWASKLPSENAGSTQDESL